LPETVIEIFVPLREITIGAIMVVGSLLIHGFGMYAVQGAFERFVAKRPLLSPRREAGMSLLILMMLATHFSEILAWAALLVGVEAMSSFRDAGYFASVTYTTLGYAEGTLPKNWRIMAPMMAVSGVFAFGWTTSVLFSIVSGGRLAPPPK
jgi:hypothetical protein